LLIALRATTSSHGSTRLGRSGSLRQAIRNVSSTASFATSAGALRNA